MCLTRVHTKLPTETVQVQEGIRLCRGEPGPDEVEALVEFLFENGRQVGRGGDFSPSKGEVRRSYSYRRPIRCEGKVWGGQFLSRPRFFPRVEREDLYCVPEHFINRKEREEDEAAEAELAQIRFWSNLL
jgi:hypothetical protein